MCGLLGYASRGRDLPLKDALRSIRHRGPDAQCAWQGDSAGGRVGLGHARLSIVDLSEAANQPFVSPCGRYRLIFNGEIYNHQDLRRELVDAGVAFRTRSDTEVLMAAIDRWGVGALSRLDGMFAFVMHDAQTGRLLLARDHFGIKPLYFTHDAARGELAFASEIQALLALTGHEAVPDPNSLPAFLMNGFLYEPDTGLQGVRKLGPGQYGEYDIASGQLSSATYHDPLAPGAPARFEDLLAESMALQTCADVPVGLFFSGGMDSTALALFTPQDLTALFVDYGPDGGDLGLDRVYAGRIAERLGMPLKVLHQAPRAQTAAEILQDFDDVAAGTEEPISDYTYIATRGISKLAAESGFKVMLSGMGGDELFGGYPRHRLARHWRALRLLRGGADAIGAVMARRPGFEKKAQRLRSFLSEGDFAAAYTQLVGYFSADETVELTGVGGRAAWLAPLNARMAATAGLSPLKQAMHLDLFGFLSHNLTVTDRASMAHSLEVRVPLLTPKLAAWAFQQPDDALVGLRAAKRPLHGLLRSRLGKALADRPKQGFNPPLDQKIAIVGKDSIRERLTGGALAGYVDTKACLRILDSHFSGAANETYRLWQLLYLSAWLERQKTLNLARAA